jgi:hypothetical protein
LKLTCMVVPDTSVETVLQHAYPGRGATLGAPATVRECIDQGWSTPHIAALGQNVLLFDGTVVDNLIEHYDSGELDPDPSFGGTMATFQWLEEVASGRSVSVQFVEGGFQRRVFHVDLDEGRVTGRGEALPIESSVVAKVASELGEASLAEEWRRDSATHTDAEGWPTPQACRVDLLRPLVIGLLSELVGMDFLSEQCLSSPAHRIEFDR